MESCPVLSNILLCELMVVMLSHVWLWHFSLNFGNRLACTYEFIFEHVLIFLSYLFLSIFDWSNSKYFEKLTQRETVLIILFFWFESLLCKKWISFWGWKFKHNLCDWKLTCENIWLYFSYLTFNYIQLILVVQINYWIFILWSPNFDFFYFSPFSLFCPTPLFCIEFYLIKEIYT